MVHDPRQGVNRERPSTIDTAWLWETGRGAGADWDGEESVQRQEARMQEPLLPRPLQVSAPCCRLPPCSFGPPARLALPLGDSDRFYFGHFHRQLAVVHPQRSVSGRDCRRPVHRRYLA